jgi:hypothetical protein
VLRYEGQVERAFFRLLRELEHCQNKRLEGHSDVSNSEEAGFVLAASTPQ